VSRRDGEHSIDRDWRIPRIAAREMDARSIRDTLEHLDDLAEMFVYEKDEETATEIRTLMGLLKTRASDAEAEAGALEAAVQTRAGEAKKEADRAAT
jgi:hypothetical protein